jgi:AraC family transcriptional regulator of adaptative response / DNA-3-methyladenine glycosylase II
MPGWLVAASTRAPPGAAAVSDSLRPVLPLVIRRVRAMLDLDADPHGHQRRAARQLSAPTACACRARSAATSWRCAPCSASRSRWRRRARWRSGWSTASAKPIETPVAGTHAAVSHARGAGGREGDALGQLGIVRQRQAAIVAIARAVAEGRCTCMRAPTCPRRCGAQDAAGHRRLDRAVHRHARAALARCLSGRRRRAAEGAGRAAPKNAAREAEAASQAWKPWRSYAVVRAWAPSVPFAGMPNPGISHHHHGRPHRLTMS